MLLFLGHQYSNFTVMQQQQQSKIKVQFMIHSYISPKQDLLLQG